MKTLHPVRLVAALSVAFCTTLFAAPPELGLDRAGMDTTVRPQDDLFRAMNGNWAKNTAIPADKAWYGITVIMRDLSDRRLKGIVETLAGRGQPPGGVEQKIADFYNAFLDTDAIDKAGLAPLAGHFEQIDAVHDARGLMALMGRWQSLVDVPLLLGTTADFKNPDIYSPLTWQGGLGLPDRDYYLKDDEQFAGKRAAYRAYVEKLLSLSGDKSAAAHAGDVVALEKRIATIQWPQVDLRDSAKLYNPTTVGELRATAPGIDWQAFLAAGQMPVPDTISISQPSYVVALSRLVGEVPIDTWRTYLRARLLDEVSAVLPAAYRAARFEYRGRALRGLTEDVPRWQKAIQALNDALGEALGQIYVAQYFPPAYKARMLDLVGNLLKAYAGSIDGLAWMSPATKAAAREKLAKYTAKIGYPDQWRDYSRLEVRAGDPLGNLMRAARFEYLRQAVRIGKKVDRAEWGMTPQTVNAYYDASLNEIVFPAAYLQPPNFDMHADDAVNYGAIGATIGHEISHGFDDDGSKFDGDGRLRDWWTEADRKAFDAITSRLVAQYSAYEAIKGTHVDGALTLGENIADLSGLQIAFKAYELSLGGKPAPVIDGLTGEQRFFLSFAQSWRDKMRDEFMLQLLTTDSHSPPEFRANGAAVNTDGFHEAFGTKPGDGMYKPPGDRIRLW